MPGPWHFGTRKSTIINRPIESYTDSVMEMCYLYDGVPVDRSSSTGRDADGTRVAKGRITAWSCDPAVNGFQTTSDYILGPSGEQVTEMAMDANNSMAWRHTNVWAGGKLLATYDNDGLHFYLNDPLGTRRAQTDYAGVLEQTCSSLPFGDGLSCSGGNLQAPTEHHFTGKERDAESGNDYFGARYYASNMGRWMSPDKPFADQHTSNPQSWNLYEYARNNPLRNVDPNGFKVLQAVVAEALAKMNAGQGGTFYLDFAGIQGLHTHQSLGPWADFGRWHSDHFTSNSEIIPNKGILSGFFRAFFGLANKDQVDTGKAIVAAAPAGVNIAFDTYSNGVNAAGQVAQGMSAGDFESATVVGPNANSAAPIQAMDQADEDSTQIFISTNDLALALAFFGSQSVDDWTSEFGDRVHVTSQSSHNLNKYHDANSEARKGELEYCARYGFSCN